MHCWNCEESIDITKGMLEVPLYVMNLKAYSPFKALILECPYCEQLIAITDYNLKELTPVIKSKGQKIGIL